MESAEGAMLRIGLVAVFLLLGCATHDDRQAWPPPAARLAPEAACLPWTSAVRTMEGADPRSSIVYVDEGDDARRLLTFVNAMPPISHAAGDRVAVIYAPSRQVFLFIVGQQRCLAAVVRVPAEQLERFVGTSI